MYFKPFFATLVVALTAASSVQAISGDGKHGDITHYTIVLTQSSSFVATHFTPNDKKGACGVAIPNTEHAVGLSPGRFMNGAACGKKIKVHRQYRPRFP